ncbi:MAG: diguanylate cyclase [Planctomycetota bacterium]|nr:diguanylate cyclase [Planctomycetota bacterium]
MKNIDFLSDADKPKILLIGDAEKLFSDGQDICGLGVEIRSNILDGIETAGGGDFDLIAVAMSGSSAKLSSAIEALRTANSGSRRAKIILLAQMYQEPAARQLVGSASNGGMADDYLICPTNFSYLVSRISYLESRATSDERRTTEIQELEKLATTDELTGLKNRRYIWEFSRQIIEHARKQTGRVTLLIFDIDDFKHYNDVYGHSAGDDILRQAAILMRHCCRCHDIVGRVGGDEFAVIFWDDPHRKPADTEAERRSAADHPKEAIFIANRLRKELSKAQFPLLGPQGRGVLTISGGLASFPRDGSTVDELFDQADKALLDAKRSGKNRIYLVGKPENDIADME